MKQEIREQKKRIDQACQDQHYTGGMGELAFYVALRSMAEDPAVMKKLIQSVIDSIPSLLVNETKP
jgi:hypothetical protein